jgi:uncharacterized alkaline shock family protein YloU
MTAVETRKRRDVNRPTQDLVEAEVEQVPAPAPAPASEPAGQTTYADRAVGKIAAQAADEISAAGGSARRVLGVPVGDDAAADKARADVQVDGSIVTARLRMSVAYPAPIRKTTRAVREHVVNRVSELTGLSVQEVDIDIVALTTAPPRRRVQ